MDHLRIAVTEMEAVQMAMMSIAAMGNFIAVMTALNTLKQKEEFFVPVLVAVNENNIMFYQLFMHCEMTYVMFVSRNLWKRVDVHVWRMIPVI